MNFAQLLILDPSSFRRRPVPPTFDTIKYGLLYNWWATREQGTGVWLVGDDMRSERWDVPTDASWTTLITEQGGSGVAGLKLKESGLLFWNTDNGTNNVKFNARGSGFRNYLGEFNNIDIEFIAVARRTTNWFFLISDLGNIILTGGTQPAQGFAYRPVRPATTDEQLLPDGELTGVYYYGNDGKKYRVTKIGTQVWLADNLAETKWSDGSWIQGYDGGVYTPISDVNWAALTTAALCAYGDDISNI